jgi:pectin methylesterase-like acyl-CoA thioesterase
LPLVLTTVKQPVQQLPLLHQTMCPSYGGSETNTAQLGKSAVIKRTSEGTIHVVEDGQSIEAAVEKSQPSDTIKVMPGTYSETVYIDKDDIRLIGVIIEGKRATLNGLVKLNDAILYSGNNIVVENFHITKYKGNDIMSQTGNNFEICNNIIVDTGVYGIFPQLGQKRLN